MSATRREALISCLLVAGALNLTAAYRELMKDKNDKLPADNNNPERFFIPDSTKQRELVTINLDGWDYAITFVIGDEQVSISAREAFEALKATKESIRK